MPFVSPEEAAWVFGATPQTIRAWIAEGTLKTAPRVGRRHRIYIESVAEKSGLSMEQVREIVDAGRSQASGRNMTNKYRACVAVRV
jgi:excisionase family DNA binding protein